MALVTPSMVAVTGTGGDQTDVLAAARTVRICLDCGVNFSIRPKVLASKVGMQVGEHPPASPKS